MSNKKYTDEDIRLIISKYGLQLIEYKDTKNIFCIDKDGYKYKVVLYNLINKQKCPERFRQNPFVIENISLFLKQNKSTLILKSDTYYDSTKKLSFICEKHIDKGEQYRTLDYLVNRNCFCKYCNIEKRGKEKRIDLNIILARCNELNLTYVNHCTKNGETKVEFICPYHNEKGVQIIAWYHLKTCSKGCPYCAGKYMTTDDFQLKINTLGLDIDILGEYKHSETPIKCKCRKCNCIWSPIPRSLVNKQGCPKCKSSKGEKAISDYLEKNNIKYVSQKTFEDCKSIKKLKFDFYLPDFNICIEYDGEQHYKPIDFSGNNDADKIFNETKQRDKIKDDYCNNCNIKLIRIPYWDFNNIDSILNKIIQ